MNALECHILFTVLFTVGLLLIVWDYMGSMNRLCSFKTSKSWFGFNTFISTMILMVLTGVSAFASISALLIHLFGK